MCVWVWALLGPECVCVSIYPSIYLFVCSSYI